MCCVDVESRQKNKDMYLCFHDRGIVKRVIEQNVCCVVVVNILVVCDTFIAYSGIVMRCDTFPNEPTAIIQLQCS